MNQNQFLGLTMLFFFGIITLEAVADQIEIIDGIEFTQTGKLFTDKKEFIIINEINTREFFDGKIIRIA
jgi:hypothetical protein